MLETINIIENHAKILFMQNITKIELKKYFFYSKLIQ
jgi:hypothetical protein